MTIIALLTIAAVWIVLSAIVLVSICMLSSRLSKQEELEEIRFQESSRPSYPVSERDHSIPNRPKPDMLESTAG